MIISHKNKFIFIKTKKTAGTSIEIALSKFCGPDDVITPIVQEDEKTRLELGYPGPQNYVIPYHEYSLFDYLRAVCKLKRLKFYNHARASFIKKHLSREIWDTYFKFCFERNPWDKAVSLYYWRNPAEPRPSLSRFIHTRKLRSVSNFHFYSESSEIIVDRVFKYEEMDAALDEIRKSTGLPETPSLPQSKSKTRKNKQSYRELFTPEDRGRIEKMFAREIALFNYKF